MEILELLKLIKSHYLSTHISIQGETYAGLCHLTDDMYERGIISREDFRAFRAYYMKYIKNRKVFYTSSGVKTSRTYQFAWKMESRKPRLNWLDKQIKKLEV